MTTLWTLAFILSFVGLAFLVQDLSSISLGSSSLSHQKKNLHRTISLFREIEETLMTGLVPSLDRWEGLKTLDEPWRSLSVDSLKELRDCGGALLPTLKRLRELAEAHHLAIEEGRARASQAFAQALACSLLVPLLGGSLYILLPGLHENRGYWLAACIIALLLTGSGSLWLLQLADSARWGGLKSEKRTWLLSSQCAGERFLALVRVGTPPDLAWIKACELLKKDSLSLLHAWGTLIWQNSQLQVKQSAEKLIVGAGISIKKSVQVSLMEGRPCLERAEAALLGLRQDMKVQVERELSLLPTRALKPLFLCVAPSLLGLLAVGLGFAAFESMGSP